VKEREVYEVPQIEVIEFELSDSIATSANIQGIFGFEELWGDE